MEDLDLRLISETTGYSLVTTNPDTDNRENVQVRFKGESIELNIKSFVGMEFDKLAVSEVFWTRFGYETGFCIRKRGTNLGKNDMATSKTYLCSKQGQKGEDKRRLNAKPWADTRCNCDVLMKISLNKKKRKYYVKKFVDAHNHELEGKDTVHNFRAHQNISESQARDIDMASRADLRSKQTHRYMAIQAGGSENLSFTRNRLNSHLQHQNPRVKNIDLGETTAILDYFQEKSRENSSFYHAYQLDQDRNITNFFWVNSSILVDYEVFGDVVYFNTTFGTNNASRPLEIFSGLNNHPQIVVFGVCLYKVVWLPFFLASFFLL